MRGEGWSRREVFRRSAQAGAAAAVGGPLLAACGDTGGSGARAGSGPAGSEEGGGWAQVRERARGQTVSLWMYGGNNPLNEFIDHIVAPRADKLGVGIHRVPVSDTGAAVQRVLAERRAGKTSGGSVDAVWINGENFATGKKAGLWLAGDWARDLPNARYLNFADPLVTKDFQVPTGGQESAWMRAAFIFAYDTARTPTPPKTFAELMAYARAHPGRVTYPAPPDFTGSAFVRQVIQRLGSRQKGLAYLERLKPLQYRGGKHFPSSEDALNTLFGNGQVDFAMSYSPYFLSVAVKQGRFPASARPFLIGGGALQNFSFVTIPANAAHPDGARVLADLLLDPAVQLIQADPQHANSPGSPTVLDLAKLAKPERAKFHDAVGGKYVITDYGAPLPELPAGVVPTIEQQWRQRVLAS